LSLFQFTMDTSLGTSEIRNLLNLYRNLPVTTGMSGAKVYHLPELSAYLKLGETGKVSDLERERDVLDWLKGRFPAPQVLGYEKFPGGEALLITEISGVPGSEYISASSVTVEKVENAARKAAAAMRRLHEIPIDGCALDMRLAARLARSRRSIELGLLSETDAEFQTEHDGKTTWEVYKELATRRPDVEDLVFTHGDPCMPNMIFSGGEIAGFIDLDGAGVADRYADIAIFFRSFRRNARVRIDLGSVFLEAYGLDAIDRDKFEYYGLIDDLF
jgi:aminoglycoside phosphotransferase